MQVWKGKPIKKLTMPYLGALGRSLSGRITSKHRQAGHRRRLRIIDRFYLSKSPAFIRRFEYDPVGNVTLALLCHSHGFLSYIVAPKGSVAGDFIYPYNYFDSELSGSFATFGSVLELRFISVGSTIYNVESFGTGGATLSRSGGSSSQVIAKLGGRVLLKLPSGKYKTLSNLLKCQFGVSASSRGLQRSRPLRKAGQSRWLGRRPHVRGVAMNPVDHPHGGGEGKTSGGRCSVTPWGFLTKGRKTRLINSSRLELKKFYRRKK